MKIEYPNEKKNNKNEVFIPLLTDETKKIVDPTFYIYTKSGLSYNSTTEKKINENIGTFATFDFVSLPDDFEKIFDEQKKKISENNGKITLEDFEDITYENTIYRFVPTTFELSANNGFETKLDIKLYAEDKTLLPKEILEHFGDYRLYEGYLTKNVSLNENDNIWLSSEIGGMAKSTIQKEQLAARELSNKKPEAAIKELSSRVHYKNELLEDVHKQLLQSKKEIERLKKENEHLKHLVEAYREQLGYNNSNYTR